MKIFAFASILLISGCTSLEDVTTQEYVKLKMGLVTNTQSLFLCAKGLDTNLNTQLVINYGFQQCQFGKHVLEIPINSKLKLNKIVRHNDLSLYSIDKWLVLGEYQGVEFYYQLDWVQQKDGTFFKQNKIFPWKYTYNKPLKQDK
jgi:hypothetical protein